MIRTICVTGGIASGKTVVTDLFSRLGAEVVSADEVARSLMRAPRLQAELTTALGQGYFTDNGDIRSEELADLLFTDRDARQRVNDIVHPHVYQEVERRYRGLDPDRATCFVVETALAVETGYADWFDTVVVVTAPTPERIRRLMSGTGLTEAEAELRIEAQLSQERKVERADRVLENHGPIEELEADAATLFRELCEDE